MDMNTNNIWRFYAVLLSFGFLCFVLLEGGAALAALLLIVLMLNWKALLGMILALGLLAIVLGEQARKKMFSLLFRLAKMILLGLLCLICAFVVWNTWRIYSYVPEGRTMYTETSPDKRFTVAIYPSPSLFPRFAMPGQGGDGPGLIILRDNRTGKELQRKHVDSFWHIYTTVDWNKDSVYLSRADDRIEWRLPR
jgi:hypothetical protein